VLTRLLTLLPLLLCPLLMLVCMWMMRNREPPQRQDDAAQDELPTAARIARLERELADLRARFPEADPVGEPARAAAPDPSRHACNGTPVQPG
jgi:hypothetical protein